VLDLIAFLAVVAVNRLLYVMPMEFDLWLGRSLGGVFYALSGKRKMVTYANLRAAFCREKTPKELRVMAKASYTQAAQTFAELIFMAKVDAAHIEKYVTIRNFERVTEAAKNPKGMMLISAHFGNWELSLVTAAVKGHPLYILAREQKMKRLNELFNRLRESKGSVVVKKGADIKRLIRVLRDGKSVGLLADQNAGANGELLELFGRKASTAVGPYRLAQKGGAVILPAFIHRKRGPYHELVVEEIISIKENEDIVPYMEKYNRLLEKHIKEDPEQWFWMHKKWKMNPERKIMVLDDGKKGHLNQSMAIVREIKTYRESEGRDSENIKVNVVRVDFLSDLRKAVFKMLAPIFGRNCQGRLGLLKWAFDKQSYDKVSKEYADIIISTGSSLASVNMMLKSENYARNVAVLDPGVLIRRKFDLVIIPRHDVKKGNEGAKKEKSNIVVTDLAPNLIKAEDMRKDNGAGQDVSLQSEKANVGIFIGGKNKHFVFSEKMIREILSSVTEFCEEHDSFLHVTTSRRTSPKIEKTVEEVLFGQPRCKTLVMGSKDKDLGTVSRIMCECDILIVSLESISMVSEAVSSGKRVMVFMPDKVSRKETKYERFSDLLASRGYLTRVNPGEIKTKAGEILKKKDSSKIINDGRRIREKLYRLF